MINFVRYAKCKVTLLKIVGLMLKTSNFEGKDVLEGIIQIIEKMRKLISSYQINQGIYIDNSPTRNLNGVQVHPNMQHFIRGNYQGNNFPHFSSSRNNFNAHILNVHVLKSSNNVYQGHNSHQNNQNNYHYSKNQKYANK